MDALVPVEQKYDLSTFNSISSGTTFLPRMNLGQGMSKVVQSGQIKQGHWYTTDGEEVTDLGTEVKVIVLAWRPRAIDTSADDVINNFDVNSEQFREIAGRANQPDSGCMYGPEFLFYIPSTNQFITTLFGSKTLRNDGQKVLRFLGKHIILESRTITKGRRTWFGANTKECSTPPDRLPDQEVLTETLKQFNNPISDEVVEETPSEGRER